jgi:hypothetical protein
MLFTSTTFTMAFPESSSSSAAPGAELATINFDVSREAVPADPSANPFRLVVDPVMRVRLRKALFDLIENHDQELARYVADGALALDSYKEYIELFSRSLRETVGSRDGVAYLLSSCGFDVAKDDINLEPETRWRVTREAPQPATTSGTSRPL